MFHLSGRSWGLCWLNRSDQRQRENHVQYTDCFTTVTVERHRDGSSGPNSTTAGNPVRAHAVDGVGARGCHEWDPDAYTLGVFCSSCVCYMCSMCVDISMVCVLFKLCVQSRMACSTCKATRHAILVSCEHGHC